NTDGESKSNDIAGCGGLIRGVDRESLGSFTKFIGRCSTFVAELWDVLEGLKLAKERGFNRIEICVDSAAVISTIINGGGGNVYGI
ncbi:ribonuclease H protein, partial [Trifolium medium]|nr:ribonuclease H protein [Trifolium medium]